VPGSESSKLNIPVKGSFHYLLNMRTEPLAWRVTAVVSLTMLAAVALWQSLLRAPPTALLPLMQHAAGRSSPGRGWHDTLLHAALHLACSTASSLRAITPGLQSWRMWNSRPW
jgi:hypothetical protein